MLIASKGIYANHSLEASLGLTALIHSKSSALPRTYLVYVNRSRTDALRGLFAGSKRTLIGGRLRDGAGKTWKCSERGSRANTLRPPSIQWTRRFHPAMKVGNLFHYPFCNGHTRNLRLKHVFLFMANADFAEAY